MPETILVTGASGFLGSHIVRELLSKGYRVRALIREPRIAEIRKLYEKFGDQFEAVAISDISTDEFPAAFNGVAGLIHSASPLVGKATPENILKGAVEGTLNVLRQTEKAGVKRVVFTSSVSTSVNARMSFTDQDWAPVNKETALNGTQMDVYSASKTLAELELWDFADAHPSLDVTSINPPFLYGPFTEEFTLPKPHYASLSSNIMIYRLLFPEGQFPSTPSHADVRDVAKAHVIALSESTPCSTAVGRKRILFASPNGFNMKAVFDIIAEKRPELKNRLTKATPPTLPYDRLPLKFDRIQEVLGLQKSDFRTVEETILDAVDSLLTIEKGWIDQGYEIALPGTPGT